MRLINPRLCGFLLLGAASFGCAAGNEPGGELDEAEQALTTSDVELPVALRGTGSATLHATVFRNPRRGVVHENVLAIHGLAETAATFGPLAEALYHDASLGKRVRNVVALDLIGHGKSGNPTGLPSGVSFGQLTIDDNVNVILQALQALRHRQLAPHIIVAHSMGGLAVQALQQKLLDRGSSLAALGVRQVVLLAPVPAPGSPWVRPPTPDLSAFVVQDPALGPYVSLPAALFVAQAFSTTAGTVATDAPTADEVAARGYSAIEPLYTLLQLSDTPVPQADGSTLLLARPSVDAGVFARRHGTVLSLASFSEDTLVPASNLPALYRYLTGDVSDSHYLPIVGPNAVHSSYISNPAAILTALRNAP